MLVGCGGFLVTLCVSFRLVVCLNVCFVLFAFWYFNSVALLVVVYVNILFSWCFAVLFGCLFWCFCLFDCVVVV